MSLRTPNVQTRSQYGRDWGNYPTATDLPNTTGFTAPLLQLASLEVGDTAHVDGQGSWVCESVGVLGAGDAIWRSAQVSLWRDSVTRTIAVAGQYSAFLPWGVFLSSAVSETQVFLNGTLLSYAVDWDFALRQANKGGWPQPSTSDVAVGVRLIVATNPGDEVEIRWLTGAINLPPPIPMPVYTVGGALPSPIGGPLTTFRYNNAQPPNAVVVPNRLGFQVEVWRMAKKNGRMREPLSLPGFSQYMSGRRFAPYFRLPAGAGEAFFLPGAISGRGRKSIYRVCYYDPNTGARSDLSHERIYYTRRDDQIRNTNNPLHPAGAVWVA